MVHFIEFHSHRYTVKPRNSRQLEQWDFFRYCEVFRYFEGSEALNRALRGQKLSAIEGLYLFQFWAYAVKIL